MARTSSAVLAALLAALPVVATAQTATDATTPPVVTPESAAAGEAAKDAATTATDAAKAAETAAGDAAKAATEAATAAGDAARAATDSAGDAAKAATDAATEAAGNAAKDAGDAAKAAADSVGDAAKDAGDAAKAAADAATGATPADTTSAATDTPAADAAPAAAPAAAGEDQVGSYYTKSTHGDWLLRCLKTADGKDPCELYQLLKDQGEKPVAEVSVIPFTGKAAAIVNFVAPLETDLQGGIGLQIDAAKEHRYPFLVCAPIGCVSRVGMTEAELAGMKKGSKSTVSLLPFGADPAKDLVKLDMSLKGFTAGFTALQDAVKAEQQTPKN